MVDYKVMYECPDTLQWKRWGREPYQTLSAANDEARRIERELHVNAYAEEIKSRSPGAVTCTAAEGFNHRARRCSPGNARNADPSGKAGRSTWQGPLFANYEEKKGHGLRGQSVQRHFSFLRNNSRPIGASSQLRNRKR